MTDKHDSASNIHVWRHWLKISSYEVLIMHVHATHAHHAIPYNQAQMRLTASSPEKPAVSANVSRDDTVDQPVTTDKRANGVIRLLQAGHFNGVADLRHRIKLHDELQAQGIELPEPNPPKGNGRAYEKFLAIYNSLSQSEPSEQPDSVVDKPTSGITADVGGMPHILSNRASLDTSATKDQLLKPVIDVAGTTGVANSIADTAHHRVYMSLNIVA